MLRQTKIIIDFKISIYESILKGLISFILLNILFTAKAWGPEGYTIVATSALQIVKDDVRQNVLNYLNGMPIDTAANWMDIIKSNTDYEFIRPWHYFDFAKGTAHKPAQKR